MTWLLIGTGLLLAFLYYGRKFVNADPKALVRYVRQGGAVAAILIGLYLSLRGGIVFGGPLIVFGLGFLFPGLSIPGLNIGRNGPSAGGASKVDTDFVRMRLDRDSGSIDGEVKKGAFAGRKLAELDEAQVRSLLTEASADRDAVALLNAYIARRFGGATGGSRSPAAPQGAMTEEEALAILGLQRGATADEVRAAHKRLMVKVHPDQGGSGWLAAKLNAAREKLVGKG